MAETKKYVVLRHLTMPDKGRCFFTSNGKKGTECEYGYTGERWYEAVGYADTVEEAQHLCHINYGGLPSWEEFEKYAKETFKKRFGREAGDIAEELLTNN